MGQELWVSVVYEWSDPSRNYGGWKAAAVGANNQTAQSILKKKDYKVGATREERVELSLKLELAEVFSTPSGNVKYHVHSPDSLTKLLLKQGVSQPASETC